MTETMRLPGLMKLALYLVGFYPGYPAFATALDSPMITAAPFIVRDDAGQIVGSEIIGYASVDGSCKFNHLASAIQARMLIAICIQIAPARVRRVQH